MILDGIMILWFAEVLVSVVFVAVDIVHTPESPVLKWGFVIVTLYMGPIGLVLYLLSCREPFPGTHAEYVRPRWRQVVGSTMHCVAGDGIGILVAAAVLTPLGLPEWVDLCAEYALGFLFGWTIFQALFMKDMAGGNYGKSLRMTFLPEFVSMNGLMAGMIALSVPWRQSLGDLSVPSRPEFWFVLSLSLTFGFAVTYPLNWWLVSAGLKHGMMTMQPTGEPTPLAAGIALAGAAMSAGGGHSMGHGSTDGSMSHQSMGHEPMGSMDDSMGSEATHASTQSSATAQPGQSPPAAAPMAMAPVSRVEKGWMIAVSLIVLTAGLVVAGTLGSLTVR